MRETPVVIEISNSSAWKDLAHSFGLLELKLKLSILICFFWMDKATLHIRLGCRVQESNDTTTQKMMLRQNAPPDLQRDAEVVRPIAGCAAHTLSAEKNGASLLAQRWNDCGGSQFFSAETARSTCSSRFTKIWQNAPRPPALINFSSNC